MFHDELEALISEITESWHLTQSFQDTVVSPAMLEVAMPIQQLLRQCKVAVAIDKCELMIEACSKTTALAFSKLRSRKRDLAAIAGKLALRKVAVYYEGVLYYAFNIESFHHRGVETMITKITSNQNKELVNEVLDYPHSSTIVRLADSVCLFSNDQPTREFTGLDPTSYLGQSVANLWIPAETERLLGYLERDGQVTEYEYKGYRKIDVIQGTFQEIEFCADFRLVEFMGHRCRLGVFRFKE